MAKAAGEVSTTWMLLRDARALVINVYQNVATAQRWLQERLEKGAIRWRYWMTERRWDGAPVPLPSAEPGEPSAWCWHDPARPGRTVLTINWQDSQIHRADEGRYSRVELAREDILALLPQELVAEPLPQELITAKEWLDGARAQYPRQHGERMTDYAKRLHDHMQAAGTVAPSLRVMKADTIRKRLYEAAKADKAAR
jgi:hypothetical protein